ncbi:MAG: ribosome assembly cofactor RimP [Tannerellaceae bacterium]|nr:ribosome assembly cofactor RimP [Tannerellaceae bacterium]
MIDKQLIVGLVEEFLSTTEHYLVDVMIKPGNLIVVEIDNDEAVSTEDCAALSRFLESKLDRDMEDYELEVGSAGITSPFKILRQYQKYTGKEVEVLLKNGMKQTGILQSADENGIVLVVEKKIKPEGSKRKVTVQEEQPYTYEEIKNTKYLLRFK